MKTTATGAALALATTIAVGAAAPAASAPTTGHSPGLDATGANTARAPFASVVREASAAAAQARREQLALRRAFPVRGPFNWGQEAAAFGGPRSGRSHEGQDVLSREGTPEVAVAPATVLETGNDGGRGNYLVLWDARRKITYVYMHMESAPQVKQGDHVEAGQHVGTLGCTGSCDGPHLHFEVRDGKGAEGTTAHDPRPLLEQLSRQDNIPASLPPGQG